MNGSVRGCPTPDPNIPVSKRTGLPIMEFSHFTSLIESTVDPVVLIEGRRSIPDEAKYSARSLSSSLARRFPHLRFRSGNATGSDEAFSSGVLDVAPERMEIIAPYASHRAKNRNPLARYESPESLSPDELLHVQALTAEATPANRGLMKCYGRGGRAGAQAACLIRDTMKVTGFRGLADPMSCALHPPVAALFWVDPADPDAGGTGHTIRVCRIRGIPVMFQNEWQQWLGKTRTEP